MYESSDIFSTTGVQKEISPRMLLFLVIAVIIILVGIAFWYFRPEAKDVIAMGPWRLTAQGLNRVENPWKAILDFKDIVKTTGNNTTCSFFVYMDDVNRENISIMGPKGNFQFKYMTILGNSIGIMFDPIHQKAVVTIIPMMINTRKIDPVQIEVPNVLIAKWNQLTVTVEGRTVDIYVNGKLAKSTLLENVPFTTFSGVMLNTSPDFSGQTGLFQIWPERRTATQIMENYKRNTDTRGKPLIPDVTVWKDIWSRMKKEVCNSTGICGVQFRVSPLHYVDYEFA